MSEDILGQYAIFVGPAYVLTLVVFITLALITRRRLRHWAKRATRHDDEESKKTRA